MHFKKQIKYFSLNHFENTINLALIIDTTGIYNIYYFYTIEYFGLILQIGERLKAPCAFCSPNCVFLFRI